MLIYTCNSDQICIEHEFFFSKLLNLPPQTLMSWNGLTHAHITDSPGHFHNTIGSSLTIP
jgi:hypothetical protein